MPGQALELLAQPRRRAILRLVWREERSAGEIAACFDVTFGAVSQHLALLREAGLVVQRREGRKLFYLADAAALGPFAAALEAMWFGKLSVLKDLAESEQRRLDGPARVSPRRPARSARRDPTIRTPRRRKGPRS